MSGPRILWVTQEVPDPNGGGGAIRQHALLTRLAEVHAVDLLVAGPVDRGTLGRVGQVIEVDGGTVPEIGRARAARELWIRRRPTFVAAARPAADHLRTALRQVAGDYDVVVLHHEELLDLLADCGTAARVVHVFDLKAERARQAAALSPSRRRRLFWRAEADRAEQRLRRWVGVADVVVTCTEADAAVVRQLGGIAGPPVAVAPNGVDLARFVPVPAPRRRSVLFLGSLDYEPNVEGITWFAREVWPSVLAAQPGASLTVAGHRPTAEVLALGGQPGVTVTGPVPDAAACLAAHDVVVVPVRIGTGSRLKALEAMASGRPTVGTSVGLEGLGVDDPGRPAAASVADDPAPFAAAVADLLADPDRADELGATGRAHVEATGSWDASARALDDAVTAVARAARGPGVSVLVCTLGRPALLERSLRSLVADLDGDDELLVVEAGEAGAAGLVADVPVVARHLVAPRPGKSRQLNQGLRAAARPVVVLTDDDCVVEPGWVRAMAAPFADPRVGVVFGDVEGLSGLPGHEPPRLRPGAPPPVTWEYANGAAMAVRRSAALAAGGYDERLGPGAPAHGEEHDLVLRLLEAGWTVQIAAAPPVRHLAWRDPAEERRNVRTYARGAGAFLGVAVRRDPRRWARMAWRRVRYQGALWRRSWPLDRTLGPLTAHDFARGFLYGLRLGPWNPDKGR